MRSYLGGGEVKEETRLILLEEIKKNFRGRIKYLGLPGLTLSFEEKLSQIQNEISMIGYERNEEISSVIMRVAATKRLPLNVIEGDINQAVGNYNLAWFDYCGRMDPDKIRSLKNFVQKNLYFNGLDSPMLAVTFLRGREDPALWEFAGYKRPPSRRSVSPTKYVAVSNGWDWIRQEWMPDQLDKAAKTIGMRFVPTRYIEYYETSPMLLMIGKVVKRNRPGFRMIEMIRRNND